MSEVSNDALSPRRLANAVHDHLKRAGAGTTQFRKEWLRFDEALGRQVVDIPIGPGETIQLILGAHRYEDAEGEEVECWGRQLAAALPLLVEGQEELLSYLGEVRAAALAKVAELRAAGLDIGVKWVGFHAVPVENLEGRAFSDIADYILAELKVSHLSQFLTTETTDLVIGDVEDLDWELKGIAESQNSRQERSRKLDELGADLELDEIALAFLEAMAPNVDEALAELARTKRLDLSKTVGEERYKLNFLLLEGVAAASFEVEGKLVWNGDQLWYLRPELMPRVDHEDRPDLTHFIPDDHLRGFEVVCRWVSDGTAISTLHPRRGRRMLFDGLGMTVRRAPLPKDGKAGGVSGPHQEPDKEAA